MDYSPLVVSWKTVVNFSICYCMHLWEIWIAIQSHRRAYKHHRNGYKDHRKDCNICRCYGKWDRNRCGNYRKFCLVGSLPSIILICQCSNLIFKTILKEANFAFRCWEPSIFYRLCGCSACILLTIFLRQYNLYEVSIYQLIINKTKNWEFLLNGNHLFVTFVKFFQN